MVFHFWEFKEAKEFIVMWRVDQGQKWAAILKQKHFQIGWEGWNVEGYNGREKDKEMTEGKGDMNTLYHRQSIGCLLVVNFLISHHFSLSLFHPPLCQPVSRHSIILRRAQRLIYECSIEGLGHERLLDVHHTHHSRIRSLVKAMKGSFE